MIRYVTLSLQLLKEPVDKFGSLSPAKLPVEIEIASFELSL